MSTVESFTIEQFYKFMAQKKLMAGKCVKCGKTHIPPRPICDACYSQDFKWVEISGKVKLLTYTIIHIAPVQFQTLVPYVIGIVELENGLKLSGMITDVSENELKVGLDLVLDFPMANSDQSWPQWARYLFKPQ